MGRLLLLLILLLASNVQAEFEVQVLALFKNAAMLNVNGRQFMLKAGQSSVEGILLVSATSKEAVVEVAGVQRTLNLSAYISATFVEPNEAASVAIILSRNGQYLTVGAINGAPVKFLVDTGANIVAMNANVARGLGIDVSRGRDMRVTTASGVANSRLVFLETVEVGGISVKNVKAAVVDGKYPTDILLGMSFLRHVEMTESSGVMNLTAKF